MRSAENSLGILENDLHYSISRLRIFAEGRPELQVASGVSLCFYYFFHTFFLRFFLNFTFRGRGREEEREGEKYQPAASHTPPIWDLAHNPGMCPDRESNLWPFVSQTGTQPTEPHQPGQTQNLQYIKRQKTEQAQNQTQIGQRCRDYQTGRFKQLGWACWGSGGESAHVGEQTGLWAQQGQAWPERHPGPVGLQLQQSTPQLTKPSSPR